MVEKCIQRLMGEPEGKGPLGRPRSRWENSVKMDIQQIRLKGVLELFWLTIGIIVGSCEDGNAPWGTVEHEEVFTS